MDQTQAREILQELVKDEEEFPFYEKGDLVAKIVGGMALTALNAQETAWLCLKYVCFQVDHGMSLWYSSHRVVYHDISVQQPG